jgi:hypothetical protein
MPRMVITHDVADIDRWLKGKAERAAAIGSAGTNVTDYVALDGSNHPRRRGCSSSSGPC